MADLKIVNETAPSCAVPRSGNEVLVSFDPRTHFKLNFEWRLANSSVCHGWTEKDPTVLWKQCWFSLLLCLLCLATSSSQFKCFGSRRFLKTFFFYTLKKSGNIKYWIFCCKIIYPFPWFFKIFALEWNFLAYTDFCFSDLQIPTILADFRYFFQEKQHIDQDKCAYR